MSTCIHRNKIQIDNHRICCDCGDKMIYCELYSLDTVEKSFFINLKKKINIYLIVILKYIINI